VQLVEGIDDVRLGKVVPLEAGRIFIRGRVATPLARKA
jgi:hypothetical protein